MSPSRPWYDFSAFPKFFLCFSYISLAFLMIFVYLASPEKLSTFILLRFSYAFPMVFLYFLCFSYDFRISCLPRETINFHFTMLFLCFSYGFPISCFPRETINFHFTMVFLCFSYGFLIILIVPLSCWPLLPAPAGPPPIS